MRSGINALALVFCASLVLGGRLDLAIAESIGEVDL
jgi:hypothetical protein